MSGPNKATVTVNLTVSIPVSRGWDSFTLATLFEDCSREARRKLAEYLKGSNFKMIGEPRMEAVVVSDEVQEDR